MAADASIRLPQAMAAGAVGGVAGGDRGSDPGRGPPAGPRATRHGGRRAARGNGIARTGQRPDQRRPALGTGAWPRAATPVLLPRLRQTVPSGVLPGRGRRGRRAAGRRAHSSGRRPSSLAGGDWPRACRRRATWPKSLLGAGAVDRRGDGLQSMDAQLALGRQPALRAWEFVPSVGSVEITRVTPGNVEVLPGESVEIAAEVRSPDRSAAMPPSWCW